MTWPPGTKPRPENEAPRGHPGPVSAPRRQRGHQADLGPRALSASPGSEEAGVKHQPPAAGRLLTGPVFWGI